MREERANLRLRALALLGLFACALVGALAMSPIFSAPVRAQGFFDDRYPFQGDRFRRGGGGGGFFQQPVEDEKPPDYSRAPAPKKAETPPASTIMVFGDAMSDWLAYGLEDALSDTPEIGVVRKHKTYSGLIRYESRRDAPEWAQAAREAIVAEKPNYIVMMLGLNDRQAIREVIQPPPAAKPQPGARTPAAPGAAATAPAPREPAPRGQAAEQKPEPQNAEPANPAADANQDAEQQPAIAASESARAGARQTAPQTLTHEYRSERWEELYIKKIDDTIAALKTTGVPVYWVGLPPVRGARSTSDTQYLNELYRNRAEKAGIAYVEVWDGFIDEAGRFTVQGPDVEGQIRRLRTSDGVYFTKAGARKLAHYLERELRRDLNRVIPVALPAPEETPAQATAARPAAPAARPLVGPVVPLNTNVSESEELLGGSTPRQSSDGVAVRALVKGEPVGGATGRADDFAWPPRAPASDYAGALPAGPPVAVVAAPKPAQPAPTRQAAAPAAPEPQRSRVAQQPQYYPGYSNYPSYPRSGPYWRSPPSPWGGRSGGGGGGGFFGLFR